MSNPDVLCAGGWCVADGEALVMEAVQLVVRTTGWWEATGRGEAGRLSDLSETSVGCWDVL